MLNFLFNINNLFIIPLSLLFLIIYKKNRLFFELSLIIFISSLFLKLMITIQYEPNNYDSIITNLILMIILGLFCFRTFENKIREETLQYLKKVILLGFGIFHLIENIPVLRGLLIYIMTIPSLLITKIAGLPFSISGIDYGSYPLYWQTSVEYVNKIIFEVHVPIQPTNIGIVLGCTGIREFLLFFSIISFSSTAKQIKTKALQIVFISIFLINILRNTIVLIYTGAKNVPFETTHHYIGGGMILLTLIGLFIFILIKIPEVNKHIENLFGLKPIE